MVQHRLDWGHDADADDGRGDERGVRACLSMRLLARRSGLSAAQVSRIEAGEVERPVAETLVKLAKALDRDAQLLLVFAGHIRGARARQLLRAAIEALPE